MLRTTALVAALALVVALPALASGSGSDGGVADSGVRAPDASPDASPDARDAGDAPAPVPETAGGDPDDATTVAEAVDPDDDSADYEGPGDDEVEDDSGRCFEASGTAKPWTPPPFSELTDDELRTRLTEDPGALGSMSLGRTNSGALIGGVQVPLPSDGDGWELVNPRESFGTRETVGFITTAIRKVREKYPDSPRVRIGDLSTERGGDLDPHLSHQAGRDADIGWYYHDATLPWPTLANRGNLDLPRSWAFLRAFFTDTDVQMIFIDKKLQVLLYDYALSVGEDKTWLDRVFQFPSHQCPGIIRHTRGHVNHFHVRFHSPRAQELGRRAYRYLLAKGSIKPPISYKRVRITRGMTLGKLAKRYRTSVSAIQKANHLRTTLIRAGKDYRIPAKGGVDYVPEVVNVPPRRAPPFNPMFDRAVGANSANRDD